MPTLDIQQGDGIVIHVPGHIVSSLPTYSLPPGDWHFKVAAVLGRPEEHPDAIGLVIEINKYHSHYISYQSLQKFPPTFTIIPIERLSGYGFIGSDKFPVQYLHTVNLGTRLQKSLPLDSAGVFQGPMTITSIWFICSMCGRVFEEHSLPAGIVTAESVYTCRYCNQLKRLK